MFSAVYGARPLLAAATALALAATVPGLAFAKSDPVLEAREAWRVKDRKKLAALTVLAQDQLHPLAPWVDYWALNSRLAEASQHELDDFYQRWRGSYVEDRLRNDWLLELGRRRAWPQLLRDHAEYKMQDDRELACYVMLAEHQGGQPATATAVRQAWLAQREADTGCMALAETLHEAGKLGDETVWLRIRLAVEAGRGRAAQQAGGLLPLLVQRDLKAVLDNAGRYLSKKAGADKRAAAELTALALQRNAAADPEQAAADMQQRWDRQLPAELAAWVWSQIGRQAALRLQPEASDYFERALKRQGKTAPAWSEDTLAWIARAALRADGGAGRWPLVLRAIELMQPATRQDPAWQYWRARALLATSKPGQPAAAEAQRLLQALASPLSFYGKLAADDLGQGLSLPPAPAPLSEAERAQAAAHPGLQRALQLIALGLRNEGVREWNFSLRGMGDRELLAAAELACRREIWDRCINTSERSRKEVDLQQRFPLPYREEIVAQAREIGLDPAYVYGLMRQESRFITDARSHVGAAGLMQVMPATARWTAKKIGLPYRPELLHERDFNLKVGTAYLKLVLDDFGGSMAMAAAAYNAGPGRPRRWRDGPTLDAAIWAENIPFSETRDYVKKVLSNATIYAHLLGTAEPPGLRSRLGGQIGPRQSTLPASNTELP